MSSQHLRAILEAVPHTPQLRTPQLVLRNRVEEAIAAVPSPHLQQEMMNALSQLLQGQTPYAFRSLQGEPACLSISHRARARRRRARAFFVSQAPPFACLRIQ